MSLFGDFAVVQRAAECFYFHLFQNENISSQLKYRETDPGVVKTSHIPRSLMIPGENSNNASKTKSPMLSRIFIIITTDMWTSQSGIACDLRVLNPITLRRTEISFALQEKCLLKQTMQCAQPYFSLTCTVKNTF